MTKLKVLVTGPFSAGKTTFINAISEIATVSTEENVWGDDRQIKDRTTVGLDFGKVMVSEDVQIYLFGTPGQDRFDFLWEDLLQGSHVVMLLIDRSNWRSVMAGKKFFDFYTSRTSVPLIIIANKSDLSDILTIDEIKTFYDLDPNYPFLECIAFNRECVRLVLETLVRELLRYV